MIILAVIGKFGGVFATIPDPVLGGTFIVSFGIIVGVGLSMLQYVQLSSMRNIFVLGVSLFFGMVLPFYVKRKPQSIDTGMSYVCALCIFEIVASVLNTLYKLCAFPLSRILITGEDVQSR